MREEEKEEIGLAHNFVTENKDLRYTFKYSERLHLQKDFERVLKFGRKMVHPAVFLYSFSRKDGDPKRRLGLITSSKIGNAVKRNRVKRQLREIFRVNKHRIDPGTDLIFIPKTALSGKNYREIEEIVLSLLKSAGMLTKY